MRLTHLTSALLALLALLTASCSRSGIHDRLDNVESFSRTEPDSALTLLSQMHDEVLYSDRSVQAHYALLYTEAEYMSGVCQTNDSLIDISVKYYSMQESDIHRMKAYYYLGQVLIYAQDYSNAVVALLNAEHTAKILKNHLWLGLIYRSIADSFTTLLDSPSALKYYDISYKEFLKAEKNIYTNHALSDLSRAYMNVFDYKKAIPLAEQTYNIAKNSGDTALLSGALVVLGKSYSRIKEYRKSNEAYVELMKLGAPHIIPSDWNDIGVSFVNINDMESASAINDSVKKYNPEDYYLSYCIYDKNKQYREALDMIWKEYSTQNKVVANFILRNFANVIDKYYSAQLDKSRNETNSEKTKNIVITVFAIIIIVIITLVIIYRHKVYSLKLKQNITATENLEKIIQEKDNELIEKRETILNNDTILKDLLQSKFETLDTLCSTCYECNNLNTFNTKIMYNAVINIINDIKYDKKINLKLENIINNLFQNLITRFKKEYPTFRDDEYQFYMFLILGFSPRAICILQDIDLKSVYNRKSYIKKRIKASNNADVDEFIKCMM